MKKILFILLLVIVALGVVSYTVSSIQRARYLSQVERVVVITLRGAVEESPAYFVTSAITPQRVYQALQQAEQDHSIKAAVLRINSPGGAVAASQEIADMIRSFSKPVVVSMGDMAASGGYYISAPADGIVAHPGTMTGSIGVILSIIDPEGLYENLGLSVEVIKSGEHKDLFQRQLTPEERELLQELSDEVYNQFISEVADGRGMEPEEVGRLATGEIFIGTKALDLGLVDRLGAVDEAIAYAAELAGLEDPVRYEFPQPGLFSQFGSFGIGIFSLAERVFLPERLSLLENVRHSFPVELRYEVK